ncbi:hypothetical protein T492DRAFT_947897 [Pavlovales sp. CCMP2436]|nr:hypothetical protein T492DRAFT_947897 [Pavlovales sp. CCMP2436]
MEAHHLLQGAPTDPHYNASSPSALTDAAAEIRTEITCLRAERESSPDFAQLAIAQLGLSPEALSRALAEDAEQRRLIEHQLISSVQGDALRSAVLAERVQREEGERRLLRHAADLATALRAELDAESRAREESGHLRARIYARLGGAEPVGCALTRTAPLDSKPRLAMGGR